MNANLEKQLHRVQAAARSNLAQLVAEEEARIIDRLVLNWNSGTCTEQMMTGAVASIASLRSMAAKAEHEFLKATDQFDKYHAGA